MIRYYCPRCQDPKTATQERGKNKIRSFRSGYVARFLECGHTIRVTNAPIKQNHAPGLTHGQISSRISKIPPEMRSSRPMASRPAEQKVKEHQVAYPVVRLGNRAYRPVAVATNRVSGERSKVWHRSRDGQTLFVTTTHSGPWLGELEIVEVVRRIRTETVMLEEDQN